MRVLHFLPDIGISNGVMSVILNYAKAMPEEIKFDVLYLLDTPENKKEEIEALGGNVYKIQSGFIKTCLFNQFVPFFENNKGKWDAVHIHIPYYSCLIAPAARRVGIHKICCHCHSTCYSLSGKYTFIFKTMNLFTKKSVKKRFACGADAGLFWYKNASDFEILNNAIDCKKYVYDDSVREKIRKDLDLQNSFIVGHIGKTNITQKNYPFILEVFSNIRKQNTKAKLLLIGAVETKELVNLCDRFGITSDVVFMGFRKDVNDLLQVCDVFLFPSTSEGVPVAVIEAQAAGLPVVMSDCITKEVCVTDLVHSLSLDDSKTKWAETCLSVYDTQRRNTLNEMQSAGWDIFKSADKLVDYYLE